jgi:hypothetical protein
VQGNDRNVTREAQTWVDHRGQDLENAANRGEELMHDHTDETGRPL